MTDAPERIWASTGRYYDYVQDWTEGEWSDDDIGGVEYIRADLATPKVKPLVWNPSEVPENCAQGEWHIARSLFGTYEIHSFDMHGETIYLLVPGVTRMQEFGSIDAALNAAQADFERRVRECLE